MICNLGECLCQRCLVHKSAASETGSPSDMHVRVVKQRKDNKKYRDTIKKARELIYDMGRVVQSKPVEELLKGKSYVPTLVCI